MFLNKLCKIFNKFFLFWDIIDKCLYFVYIHGNLWCKWIGATPVMTNMDNITENKEVVDDSLDNMKVGSYLKERLAGTSKSSSERSKNEHLHSSSGTQEDKKSDQLDEVVDEKGTERVSGKEAEGTDAKGMVLEPTISTLVLSLSSAALIALGLAIDPSQNIKEPKVDKPMAKFNIDMLIMLKEKTKGNLSLDEQKLLDAIISDLQIRYIEVN